MRTSAGCTSSPAPRPIAVRLAHQRRSSAVDRGAGTSRSRSGTTRADDRQASEQRDLGAELVRLRRHQERADEGDEQPEHDTADPPGRQGLRVRDHEEHEDEDLRRRDDHPPELEPADRREGPARDHAVPGRGEHPDARRQSDPERCCGGEETEAGRDQQPADEDDGVGRDHSEVEGRPPEVERLCPCAAEHDERHDEPDVRRVEHVRAAIPDEVLGRQAERGHAGEHVPGVKAPVVARRRARHAKDERHTAAGQHRTRRPDE